MATVTWQGSLFDAGSTSFDPASDPSRTTLRDGAWIEHAPGWLRGSDRLFARAVESLEWGARTMQMYGEHVVQPRLMAHFDVAAPPPGFEVLREVGEWLSERYGLTFERVGCNLYRDGQDSVAWHGDRIARDLPHAIIAIVSLGHRRPFRLRPRQGGRSLGFELGRGDLMVMGGTCQRTWQHAVPKVRRPIGPRISVTYRHAYDV